MNWKRWIVEGTLVLLLSPVWGFELVYHAVLGSLPWATISAPSTNASELALESLWLLHGERENSAVRPLWAGNFFQDSRQDAHGSAAAYTISRERIARHGFRGMLQWHLRTAALTVWLTRHYSGTEMQRALAAELFFGRNSHGWAEASHTFFDLPANRLSIAQTGLLVALSTEPYRADPSCFPDSAFKRREFVLRRMRNNDLIDANQFAVAEKEPLIVVRRRCPSSVTDP
jgi:hypothetical protein